MELFAFLFFFQVFLVTLCGGQVYQRYRISQNVNLENQITDFWMFHEKNLTQNPPHLIECAIGCAQDERCITFTVNERTKKCRLHAAYISEFNPLLPANGSSTYYTHEANNSVIIGHPCDSDDSCPSSNTECNGNICQCQSGYSFSPKLKSCVTECPKYGSEFVAFKNCYILLHNNRELSDAESTCPGCCEQKCLEETSFKCRSFDVLPRKCFLSNMTRADVPQDWYCVQSYKVTHHQRQCSYD